MEFRALGPLEAVGEGRFLPLGGPKQRAVLARLLIAANRVVSADSLIDQVWGHEPPASARATLHVYVANLRKILSGEPTAHGHPRLERQSTGYLVHVGADELDVDRFRQFAEAGLVALHRGDPRAASTLLGEALALWRGPAFPDLARETVPPEVAALEEERLRALEGRIQADLEEGGGPDLVAELDTLTASHPLRERFHAQRIIALYRAGRQVDALAAYQAVRSTLLDELGVVPGPELRRLETAVLRHDPSLDSPGTGRMSTPRLPAAPNRLIGRRHHVEAVASLLGAEDVRLVTLLGPGGSGKSRLALEVAALVHANFREGVYFVPLAPVTDARLVLSTIADVLGVSTAGGQPVAERLRHHLADASVLLVLDNLEHLLAAVPDIGGLMSAVPDCTVLATSRTALGLSGEREYWVPPMSLPDPDPLPPAETVARSEAVQLFVERARAVRPDFELTSDNAAAVTRICHRLDGLPLALELAAARSRVLEPDAILPRLDERLSLLTRGPRDLPARHQTLRRTIAWSYELLQPNEQRLLSDLAAFTGGFDIEAIEAVATRGAEPAASMLDEVDSLVAQSLLLSRHHSRSGRRFSMLETIREYAAERLDARPDGDEVRRRHAEHYLALAENASPRLAAGGQFLSLNTLRAEEDNLRAALTWGLRKDRTITLRLSGALAHYWEMTGAIEEGRQWLNAALDQQGPAEPEHLLPVFTGAGSMAFAQGAYDEAERLHGLALSTARALGDRAAEAFALNNLAVQTWQKGHDRRAEAAFAQATALADRAGDTRVAGMARHNLGLVASARGEYDAATRYHEEALEHFRRLDDRWSIANALHSLGQCAHQLGEVDKARSALLEGLDTAAELGMTLWIIEGLEGLGELAAHSGQPTRAVRLLAAAAHARRAIGTPLESVDRPHQEALLRDLRARLSPVGFQEAWQGGMQLRVDEAVVEARSQAREISGDGQVG